jgi:hypothetical protein
MRLTQHDSLMAMYSLILHVVHMEGNTVTNLARQQHAYKKNVTN